MADETLFVSNCGDNVSGVYEKYITDAQGKPTWKKKSGSAFLYHLPPDYDPMWAFGDRIGSASTYYTANSQGAPSPLDVSEWGRDGKPSIVAMKEQDTSLCPKKVKINSPYGNIDGTYLRMDNDYQCYPAYKNDSSGVFLWHSLPFGKWLISNELGNTSNFNSCESDEVNVTKLASRMWKEPEGVTEIKEKKPVKAKDTSNCVKMVRVESIYDNVDGGYVRMDKDFEGYPAYHNEHDDLVLFHVEDDGKWIISNKLGSTSSYNTCESNEIDVTKLVSSMWKEPKGITAIQEITWKSTVSDFGFRDYKFPADMPSLGYEWLQKHPEYQSTDNVQWIRSTRLNRDEPEDLFGPINPNQIGQGKVGDCWLIAAISCLAEFPGAVQKLFHRRGISEEGRYDLKFYDARHDKWVDVTVDDLIPCDKRNFWEHYAKPLFSRSTGAYLWPIIVEKAFAKFVGAYSRLSGGREAFAWQAFTGCSKQYHYLREKKETQWQVYLLDLELQKLELQTDRRACPMVGGGDALNGDKMWVLLKEADKANYLMGASIGAEGDEVEHKQQNGLVQGHAYSLITALECRGFRFVKLRNPWGQHEWNGDWSDEWSGWTMYPEIQAELEFEAASDGIFWMEWRDFCKNYTSISICQMSMDKPRSTGKVIDMGNVFGHQLSDDGSALAALTSNTKKSKGTIKSAPKSPAPVTPRPVTPPNKPYASGPGQREKGITKNRPGGYDSVATGRPSSGWQKANGGYPYGAFSCPVPGQVVSRNQTPAIDRIRRDLKQMRDFLSEVRAQQTQQTQDLEQSPYSSPLMQNRRLAA